MDNKLYKGPDGTALRFFERAVQNNFQSEKRGHPVFDNCLMVEVIVPGSTESMPEFVIERTDSTTEEVTRYPHYDKYKDLVESYKSNSGHGAIAGTPLSEWPQINAGQVQTYRAMNIHTVEQLAEVSDGTLGNMGMGARQLRDKAKSWLNTRAFGVPTAQMQSENESLKAENARLQSENADLRSKLSAATTADTPATQVEQAPAVQETAPQPTLTTAPQPEPAVPVPAEELDITAVDEDEAEDPFAGLKGNEAVI